MVKPDGKQLFVAWYDRRNDTNNSLIDVYGRWGTVASNGDVTFYTNDFRTWINSTWTPTIEVHYIYDGNAVIQERDGNNLPTTTYTRGIDLSGTFQGAGGIGGLLARTSNFELPSPNAH